MFYDGLQRYPNNESPHPTCVLMGFPEWRDKGGIKVSPMARPQNSLSYATACGLGPRRERAWEHICPLFLGRNKV